MFPVSIILINLLEGVCCIFVAGLLLNPAGYGTVRGDPAPGRSPGPPVIMTGERRDVVAPKVKVDAEESSECFLEGDEANYDENHLNLTVTSGLFKTEALIPGVVYQVIISRLRPGPTIDFRIRSLINETPSGEFTSSLQEYNCGAEVFRGRIESSQRSVNWTIQSNDEFIRSNLTFQLTYQIARTSMVYTLNLTVPFSQDCRLYLAKVESKITNKDFPFLKKCEVWFPNPRHYGLIIELTRMNVPCTKGYIHFAGLNMSQHQHFRSHKQAHLCGKLEELPEADRRIYFPASHTPPLMHLHGNPVFALSYHLVDYCYNVTFVARNGSFELKPTGELMCTFKIYLPYGNRIALQLKLGDSSSTDVPKPYSSLEDQLDNESKCEGLETHLIDGDNNWRHCTKSGDAERQIEIVSRTNKVVLKVSVSAGHGDSLRLKMTYRAEPLEELIGMCGFGWVALRQFCISAFEGSKLPWPQAEMECVRQGGHLVSIRTEHAQKIVDNMLINSPGYREHNAYWIGASDKAYEGDFKWVDGLPFAYANWFPGWAQHGHYNRQPNDDGLSDQDCVEVRRIYSLPSSTSGVASSFMWNDRDCSTPNYFICERLQNDEPLEDRWMPDCNKTVILSRQHPRASVSSPGFPRQYPDNADCNIEIVAPAGYRLVLDFEELVLENEPSCSYDYLEILENTSNNTSSPENSTVARRLCGDWSSKLKLLRYVSTESKLKLRFSSDYSHHFGGFKARITMESVSVVQCADDRLHMFNNSCYLFVSYPEVTWRTAQQICNGIKANIASITSAEEERFITTNIRRTFEYRTSALYWLGGKLDTRGNFYWIDNSPVEYMGWLPGQDPSDFLTRGNGSDRCLSIQWTPSPTPMLPSGLYWKTQRCGFVGGYVCKRPNQIRGMEFDFNRTVNGTEGNITSPNYPTNYYDNLDYAIKIVGPKKTRLVIKFYKIDTEEQLECLYDYIQLRSLHVHKTIQQIDDTFKLCGNHDTEMNRFDFVSQTNQVELKFHSDYSISGSGFSLNWHAVDVSACPVQTLTAKEGHITSPNYPNFILSYLDCSITILAPTGQRVWLQFDNVDFGNGSAKHETLLMLKLGRQSPLFRPFETEDLLTEGNFVSTEERLVIKFQTGSRPRGIGFKATYKLITIVKEQRVIHLHNTTSGILLHLNYPHVAPSNTEFTQHFIAPLGWLIILELYHVKLNDIECSRDDGILEITDNYADSNGTIWRLCYGPQLDDNSVSVGPIEIYSFLNTLHLKQIGNKMGVRLNGTLRVQKDGGLKAKLLGRSNEVESCTPNPCQNGGKCLEKNTKKICHCVGHHNGIFCALNKCDLEPCVWGTCELTNTSFKCHCKSGYVGPTCEQKRRPCESNPCEGRGACIEKGDNFQCRCHAWWEGPRCEKRMAHIPYKPLSERMLHEPFWLGLMTVFVVMAVIGLVWCAKRHFPEKIEKLLAEDNDHNRSTMSSLRSASVREQLAAASSAAQQASVPITPSPGPGTTPRSLFGRLGIRKPSILSLTSPHASGYVPATARTFSLDDLLKPHPRRTPSPKKKRNNSTPTKKNAAEKKQILQQLISPGNKQLSRKVSLGELMQMSERKAKEDPDLKQETAETKFASPDSVQSALNDPKLEKKVTFARLLNKVSAEMSSGSEIELGIMHSARLGCVFARPSSTPPSPSVDARSPNSTSSNQGSDSFSSDLAIPSALSSSISDLLNRRHQRLPNGRQKPASADSILAMFRNFSASSAGVNLSSSLKVTPSSTPTASSPQDDLAGDDESSTSSIHTPVSFSSGPPESPILIRHNQSTIEVPVLDPLSAHKGSGSAGSNLLHPPTILLEIPTTISKCLSPIREMPTPLPSPMPSPAFTPIMRRRTVSSSVEDNDMSDDRISIEIPNISISYSDAEDDEMHHAQDIAIDPQAEDGFILEEAAAMQQNYKSKGRPAPLGQTREDQFQSHQNNPPLIIPMLTVETPSPTHTLSPSFPGSPPPQRSRQHQETCFPFPPVNKQSKKMLKEFDKPTSLDLPCAPPMITITCNMSEAESDAESISPATKAGGHLGAASGGMSYLSPFSMGGRGEHTASESNLSSSGYSSMASPGPSRCGSSNPLCPSEMEDQGPPGAGGTHRRPSPILKTSSNSSDCGNNLEKGTGEQRRGRSDSETLSDDPLIESNDEGIGTDHLEEKIEEGDLKSAKELEVFMTESDKILLDIPTTSCPSKLSRSEDTLDRLLPPSTSVSMKSLQLPSIVVQLDSNAVDKHLSPVSSRSESPLSDKTAGIGRFSPQFYGKYKDILPFTDSDGLYDFPSSDRVNVTSCVQPRKIGRKRDKKLQRNCKTPSPTKMQLGEVYNHLDVPSKETLIAKIPPPRKLSPKRRLNRPQVVTSSSSSDSITSSKEIRLSSSSPSPDTIRWSSPVEWIDRKMEKSHEASDEETYDDVTTSMLPKSIDFTKNQKISRLRAISHQIRFLRRLEQNLKRRDRTISPSDSFDSGDGEDSPRATSPLLQSSKSSRIEIRKSSSISKLQSNSSHFGRPARRLRNKRGELLLPQEENTWRRIVITGNGHSD